MSDAPSQLPACYAACAPYTSVEGIAPAAADIAAFLRYWPHERFVVALLNPETKEARAVTFARADIDANAAGLAKANAGGWNVYLHSPGQGGRSHGLRIAYRRGRPARDCGGPGAARGMVRGQGEGT